jgi:hypothetical protein
MDYNYDGEFDVFAKIREADTTAPCPLLVLFPVMTEQDALNDLAILVSRGLLKWEDGHYIVTEKGQQYRHAFEQAVLDAQKESVQLS